MSKPKEHIVSAEDEFDAHSTLSLISSKIGNKVTAFLKKKGVNRI